MAISGRAANSAQVRMPQRFRVSTNSKGIRRASSERLPIRRPSFPAGITVTPAKPCAAQTAAKGLPATATLVSNPTSDATRFRSCAIFSGEPKSFSQPSMSSTAVSEKSCSSRFAPPSTRGEIVHAQSRSAAYAVASCEGERHRQEIPLNASACTLVIPASTPRVCAYRLKANTFVNGGTTARIATGLPLSSCSIRTTAFTGKSGTNRHAKANVRPLNLVEERETNRTFQRLMACASASERDRRVGTTLANASLLPELQTLPTSKLRFQHWLRHGSSCPLFACTGEPTKRSSSRRTLLLKESESSVCSQSHVENDTSFSTRCDVHPPRRFRRDRRPPHPIRRCATAGRLSSTLVRAASTASRFSRRFALAAVDSIHEVTAKTVETENLSAGVPGLV